MARPKTIVAAVTAAVGLAVVPASSAFAATTTTCDAYSHNCPQVKGQKFTQPPQVKPFQDTSTLPFTGTDIAAMTVLGAAALAGGAGLAAAGRRRRSALA